MARYYVEKDGRWTVFSSIVDDFLYSDFMGFDELKALVIGEVVINKLNELETLQTERPRLNTMSYEDVMEIIREVHADEIEDTPLLCVGDWGPECTKCENYFKCPHLSAGKGYDYNKSEMENIKLGNGISREIPSPDCP